MTMAEYIEREAIKQRFNTHLPIGESIRFIIDDIPAADVVEVKHGEWTEDGYDEIPCACSYCGHEALYTSTFEEKFDYDWEENLQSVGYEEHIEHIKTPYCPYCGAKMDGERKEK